jgi:predicted lipoprotein
MANEPAREIIHRELDTSTDDPAVQVAEVVAELEGRDATDLSTMWEYADGVLDHLFSTPPDPEAQMEVEFSYESYRITVEQGGTATFVKTE